MWFMFNDNNHQFVIIDMYTSGSSHTVRGADGGCEKSITRSAFNRWVSFKKILTPSVVDSNKSNSLLNNIVYMGHC